MWGVLIHIWFFVSELQLTICIMGVHRSFMVFQQGRCQRRDN